MSLDLRRQFETAADDFLQTIGYSKDVSKHLEERISEMNKRGKYFDKINYINEKISNFEKQLNEMENDLEERKKCLENQIIDMNRQVVTDGTNTQPTIQDAQQALERYKVEVKKDKERLVTLMKERDNRESDGVGIKLLKKILPVQFDPDSTTENIHGFVKREDNTIELFSFDMTKCNVTDVANFFWGQPHKRSDDK